MPLITVEWLSCFLLQSGIDVSCKLIISFLFGIVGHIQACPKYSEIANCQCLRNEFSDFLICLHTVRHWWKLQMRFLIFVVFGQACLSMPKVLWNNKFSISWERFEWLCLFFAFGQGYMEITNWSSYFNWVLSSMAQYGQSSLNSEFPISPKRVEWLS